MKYFLVAIILFAFSHQGIAQPAKKIILVHITTGPDNPTKAALGFLVVKTALEEGHDVNMFLAGDAVWLIKDSVLNTLVGIGTGRLRDHYDVIAKSKVRIYLSAASSKARGVTEEDIKGKPAEFALPQVLVRLSVASDRLFTY